MGAVWRLSPCEEPPVLEQDRVAAMWVKIFFLVRVPTKEV
jgi:hypothetical protein